jgi:hypothetical protein
MANEKESISVKIDSLDKSKSEILNKLNSYLKANIKEEEPDNM